MYMLSNSACSQVLPCPTQRQHDWKTCPFKHAGERVARRDLRVHPYHGIACWSFKEGEVSGAATIQLPAAHEAQQAAFYLSLSHTRLMLKHSPAVQC